MSTKSIASAFSPTRVDLAGGTLDCWPLNMLWAEALTINVSIDVYTSCKVEVRPDQKVVLISQDMGLREEFESLEEALTNQDPKLGLYRAHLAFWRPSKGFELTTSSQSPIGGGLGGSSSLSVSMIKAMSQFCRQSLTAEECVRLASNLEAHLFQLPTGTQDYYPAVEAGLHFIHYRPNGNYDEIVEIKDADVFLKHFMLVYTGQPHHSGFNNWQVIKAALDRDAHTLSELSKLRQIAYDMQMVLNQGEWHAIPALFRREYQARTALSEAFCSPRIELLEKLALSRGAEAVKICGAGGGGCVLVWCPPAARREVETACQNEGFQVLKAKPLL